ncbi:MAG TPA: site-2 protease family protein [Candidatus Bipolaricaulis sp.]|nr:site-2 protease family protein [Candidatus Bipolaricaulis sp.]HRS13877.1 site-2 protease family protein [Candidatus Bipolaricaulis sp.]HRU21415.1 site-2 protease family protein [Candidatus Bipolaricaulis sp.]
MIELVYGLLALAALFLCVIPHEVAHGYVAWRLGDPTAKAAGRLTLNPIKHLDPMGSVILPLGLLLLQQFIGGRLVVFGWAKPVPINPYYFRDTWKGTLYVSLAGPGANFAMALVAAGLGRGLVALGVRNAYVLAFVALIVLLSLVLGLFNLLPVPPLDGSKVLAYFLPVRWRLALLRWEQFGLVIVVALLFLGVLQVVFTGAEAIALRLIGLRWALLSGLWG